MPEIDFKYLEYIGVHLCPLCYEIMRICIHHIYGWVKYKCTNCNLIITE